MKKYILRYDREHTLGKPGFLGVFFISMLMLNAGSVFEDGEIVNYTNGNKGFTIYVVKKAWHTGIIIKIDTIAIKEIEPLNDFASYKYVDIGWGDEEFYQSYGFDPLLAAKALFMPTNSVIRVEGYNGLKIIYNESDFFVKLELTGSQFLRLCWYISKSFIYKISRSAVGSEGNSLSEYGRWDLPTPHQQTFRGTSSGNDSTEIIMNKSIENGSKINPIALSKRLGGKIIYYKSGLKYHLLNTCNTWVARGLNSSGMNVSANLVITAERLFSEIRFIGVVYK